MYEGKTKIIFLGTGPSSGVPNLLCLTQGGCSVCLSNNNKRTNVSILVCKENTLLIDCTKDFKYQYEKHLLKEIHKQQTCGTLQLNQNKNYNYSVCKERQNIDFNTMNPLKHVVDDSLLIKHVLITHPHADAILGLDCLKQATRNTNACSIYADKKTAGYLQKNFTYLFKEEEGSMTKCGRMSMTIIDHNVEYQIMDFCVKPFYVLHGHDYAYCYLIDNRVLYVSDCSEFTIKVKAEILIIECTTKDNFAFGHLNFNDVLIIIEQVNPRITYLVGMSHLIEYYEFDKYLTQIGKNIVLAYDMLEIEF